MSNIPLPTHLRAKLGPEMKMDVHWVDMQLADGTKFMNLVVRGGTAITGRATDPNGEGPLPIFIEGHHCFTSPRAARRVMAVLGSEE